MTTVIERGFTVIELMLFLAVSGALFAALMIGVNNNISQQRYRESVTSYSALLQGQYSDVANTRNARDNDWQCADDGTISEESENGQPRGTTDCVILGRAVQIEDNGTTVVTSSVVGREPVQNDTTSDIETLKAYHPKVTSFDSRTNSIEWGSTLFTKEHKASTASFLILRSPVSGLIRVFASPDPLPADISSVINSDTASIKLMNCVRGDSGSLPTQSVSVNPRIASLDGVTVNEADPACA